MGTDPTGLYSMGELGDDILANQTRLGGAVKIGLGAAQASAGGALVATGVGSC
jgi:hypothetical protein